MTLYAIGDIQGCRAAFETLLERLSFDAARDRLWLVGDLVNRGPESAAVLRAVKGLGTAVTTVLGNHDLHLLAVAAGARDVSPRDTFTDVLDAPDAAELVDWLRRRPLLHRDAGAGRVLVHAGIPPDWDVERAAARAAEVERALRAADWARSLASLYGEARATSSDRSSDAAGTSSDARSEPERRRYTVDALTRMRYCRASGELELAHPGPPGSQPPELVPWFEMPRRRARDTHIVFGHWSALGLHRAPNLTAVDTGCVWGRELTAVPLDPPGPPVAVPCGAPPRAWLRRRRAP